MALTHAEMRNEKHSKCTIAWNVYIVCCRLSMNIYRHWLSHNNSHNLKSICFHARLWCFNQSFLFIIMYLAWRWHGGPHCESHKTKLTFRGDLSFRFFPTRFKMFHTQCEMPYKELVHWHFFRKRIGPMLWCFCVISSLGNEYHSWFELILDLE